jgi:raffinose/stachyose/melibiose transport system permease protein
MSSRTTGRPPALAERVPSHKTPAHETPAHEVPAHEVPSLTVPEQRTTEIQLHGRRTPQRRPGKSRRNLYRLWFAIPSIILVGVFFGAPFVANIAFAFLQWTSYSTTITWAGLSNFVDAYRLGFLVHPIIITVLFAIMSMLMQNIAGLGFAKALQTGGRTDRFFRSLFFVPVLFSPLAAGYIWAAALQPHGAVNTFVSAVIPGFSFDWLGNPATALIAVALVDGWKWSGLATMVYVAGLNRIPSTVIQAAKLDGAGAWQRFWQVELPLLIPSLTFNLVVTLVGSFSAIDVVFAMTNGGPGNATTVLNAQLYLQYSGGLFGSASALGLVITILVVITAVPLIGWLRRREVEM